MTSVTNIVIKAVMEQWDDKGMEHFDDKSPRSLCCHVSWSVVMTAVMEHWAENVHGVL